MAPDPPSAATLGIVPTMANLFELAASRGFPLFLDGEKASNAINATPYATSYDAFASALSGWDGRAALLQAIEAVRREADRHARVIGMLVGGSFLDQGRRTPRDVDLLMFYQSHPPAHAGCAARLNELRLSARSMDVDVRFIAIDHDPLMLVKIVSYFTTLYNRRKGADVQVRGLALVDCRAGTTSDHRP